MLKPVDVLILISYSGETEEVVKLIPSLKSFGNPIIAMTGNGKSTLARPAFACCAGEPCDQLSRLSADDDPKPSGAGSGRGAGRSGRDI
ncbi:hypothetical protein PSCICM_03880 [Pseudomonas cichorii]|uniref:SIS domain-containing protein n=1 Tax=Pseudomonas cichorii TaxID=36746 RepID=A0ABQ1DLR9_PSECI|nr:kpsF/GutQ family protein [Pseudomonas cichorii JBC1]GFM74569.1 hypothetical protein PSCICM_03880 [Pseudomonas cichorii]GFM91782.1 hypothetical protein PSCICP_17540 [Pseudomonas cichorii]